MRRGASRVFPWLLLVAACAARAAPLAIAVSQSASSLPLYVAERHGYFAAEGVQARIVACGGGASCLRALFDGKAALATAADFALVASRFERNDLLLVATYATNRDEVKVIVRKRAGIRTPAGLAGKLVGASAGSFGHYALDRWLRAHDVDPQTVALLDLQPSELAAALRAGEVDAVAVWEPHAWRLVRAFPNEALPLSASDGARHGFNLLATRAAVRGRDADLAALLRALGRAERFIAERPRDAQALLRERLGLDRRFVHSVWPGYRFEVEAARPALAETLEEQARWLLREGYAPNKTVPDFAGLLRAPTGTARSGN